MAESYLVRKKGGGTLLYSDWVVVASNGAKYRPFNNYLPSGEHVAFNWWYRDDAATGTVIHTNVTMLESGFISLVQAFRITNLPL